VCENYPVECPFAALGCKHKTPRSKLDTHIEEAKNEHQMLTAENLSATNSIISEQNKQFHQAERSIHKLTNELANMRTEFGRGLDEVLHRSNQVADEQAETNQILSQISRVMEANAKSFEVAVNAKRAPKRKADALEEASNAAKEVVASVAKVTNGKDKAPRGEKI
jgi:ABC-type transporter Mla subunit MlaD